MNLAYTIAIPTHNRSRWLAETLASLAAYTPPLGAPEGEVLIIDNASRDETPAVAAPHAARAGWRYLFEAEPGLDQARNRAVREARGEWIIFLDDDVLLEPGWLEALQEPWTRAEVGAVGGTVLPIFPDGCPPWLEGWATPLRFPDGPLTPRQMPMGANLALRRTVFDRFGLFHTELDRKGKSLLSGGETEYLKRLHAGGLTVWFASKAIVHHQFPAARMNLGYACRHGFDSARSRVLEVAASEKSRASRAFYCLSRAILNFFKSLALACAVLFLFLTGRPGSAKKALVRLARCGGYIAQALRSLPALFL